MAAMHERGSDSSRWVLSDVGQLMTCVPRDGDALGMVANAALVISEGLIVWAGPADALPADTRALPTQSAEGRLVTPGLVDCHAHPLFAGDRSYEFQRRARGESYLQIQAAGGGILATLVPTREATFDEHVRLTRARVRDALSTGTTTLEAKSGYDLSAMGELRLLKVAQEVDRKSPVHLVPTLLGAHLIPPEFKDHRRDYVAAVCEQMIPQAAAQKLCASVDVYCDANAFTLEETEAIYRAAQRHGLAIRGHVGQFEDLGGPELLARMGALSADHLEKISDAGIAAMAARKVVAVMLPTACVQLRLDPPPVSALRSAGVSMALGSDLNPGSANSPNLPLAMWLACVHYEMSVEEVWLGATTIAARALSLRDRGAIAEQKRADFVCWDAERPSEIPYRFGKNLVSSVYIAGQLAHQTTPSAL